MKEDFLHFLWKFKLFNSLDLTTTEGESIEIINGGIHNHDSGPDFSQAKIKIGSKIWSGNVEIHIKSSHWLAHKHDKDDAYKNVILHAVYENDKDIFLTQRGDLPVLELKNLIKSEYLEKYEALENSRGWIPCESQFPEIDEFKINQWIERLVISRFQRKSKEILELYFNCDKDWNETFYRWVSKSFGFKINAIAFEKLTSITPLKIIKKHSNSLLQIEALLFGQAGLLDKQSEDDYYKKLKKEYEFLSKKYGLTPMNSVQWKFSKTMPSNFPTKRIAQFAAFLHSENSTFSKILELESAEEIKALFESDVSEYWKTHFRFNASAKRKSTGKMGKQSVDGILINCVANLLFTYGRKSENEEEVEKAISLLESLPAESNGIIKKWKCLNLKVSSAKHSQGLIELKREHCEKKKCLSCSIGAELLKS